MLEFTLLARDSENYNIINWVPDGNMYRVLRACGAHFRGRNWTFLPYWVALDVGVNPINGNLLLRGPLAYNFVRSEAVPLEHRLSGPLRQTPPTHELASAP